MSLSTIRIATRRSPLAWYQAESVATALRTAWPGLETELVGIQSEGDRVTDRPLAAIGGKGLFVKALEQGLLDGRADIAVHSMKDVPADAEFPEGLHLPVIAARESPFDAFVSTRHGHPEDLPEGAVIGTCSLRRAGQLLHRLRGRVVRDLRGNVNTRLAKLDAGEFDAIVLAVAGLERLGLAERITARLEPELCLPAIGQGAIGIECRRGDVDIEAAIAPLADAATGHCVRAERALSRGLGASCLSPIAGYAELDDDGLHLRGRVAAADGSALIAGERRGDAADAERIGADLAAELLGRGAGGLVAGAA